MDINCIGKYLLKLVCIKLHEYTEIQYTIEYKYINTKNIKYY